MSAPVQTDLVEYLATLPKPMHVRTVKKPNDELVRVTSAIGKSILEFCRERVGKAFHADDLRRHVAACGSTAPASADRVLRDLRSQGVVSYRVVDRRASLYIVEACQ